MKKTAAALIFGLSLVFAAVPGGLPRSEACIRSLPCYHTVGPGETLYYISRRYCVPEWAILQANPCKIRNPDCLPPGMLLFIPPSAAFAPAPPPTTYYVLPMAPSPKPKPPIQKKPARPIEKKKDICVGEPAEKKPEPPVIKKTEPKPEHPMQKEEPPVIKKPVVPPPQVDAVPLLELPSVPPPLSLLQRIKRALAMTPWWVWLLIILAAAILVLLALLARQFRTNSRIFLEPERRYRIHP